MATDSTVIEEDILEDEDVESAEAEDEIPAEEDSAETTEEAVEPVEDWQRRFTQFKGETPEEYAKNLEDAYGHSTTEATRLAQLVKDLQLDKDRIMAQIATNPELAAQIMGQTQGQTPAQAPASPYALDPALLYARQTMEQQMEKEYHDFVEVHREMETDPVLNKEVIENLSTLSEAHRMRTGKMLTMTEGLRAAWAMAGQSFNDNEEETRMAVKENAAQSKAPAGRPTAPPEKPLFTKAQMDFARRAFPDKTDEELTEMLSQHVPQ